MQEENRLQRLKEEDILTVDINSLKDIRDVKIDMNLPCEERMKEFVRQIQNPYCFRCGNLIVQIVHKETEKTIQDCIMEYHKENSFSV